MLGCMLNPALVSCRGPRSNERAGAPGTLSQRLVAANLNPETCRQAILRRVHSDGIFIGCAGSVWNALKAAFAAGGGHRFQSRSAQPYSLACFALLVHLLLVPHDTGSLIIDLIAPVA